MEIVSPENEARDWREKYFEYEAAGVREYWVIDPMSQHLEVYALWEPEGGHSGPKRYRRIKENEGVLESTVLSGFRVRTASFWPPRPHVLDVARELGILT